MSPSSSQIATRMKMETVLDAGELEQGLVDDDIKDCLGCASTPGNYVFWPVSVAKDGSVLTFPLRYILYIMGASILALTGIATLIWEPVDILLNERLKMIPGLPAYDWWKSPPDEVILRAYVFNITNGDEFLRGEADKLKVQEVGPFIFKEKLYHTDVVFHKNGTMTYVATRKPVYLPEMNTLSLNDTITVANIGVLGMSAYLWDSSFFTKQGITFLMNRLGSKPFTKITVYNYFWNFTDPLLKFSNKIAPSLVPTDNVGVLNQVYSDFVDEVTVYIGTENGPRFFEIDRWRGGPGLGAWKNETCDSVQGSSEGVHYHQNFTKNDTLQYLRKTICRAVPLNYYKDVKKYGMTGYRFDLPNNTFSRPENPEDECYRQDMYPLLPSGISDLSPCYHNLPIVSSFPHFMNADPAITDRIEGLSPDYDQHGSAACVEPVTGIPLTAWARSQCSIYIPDMKGFPRFRRLSNMAIPMFWLEYKQEGLPFYITYLMYFVVVVLPSTQFYISLGAVIAAFILFSIISSKFLNMCVISKKGLYKSMNVIVVKSKPTILPST